MVDPKWNEIILYSIPNSFSKQIYLQRFDFQIPYKKAIDKFEHIDIIDSIYEGLVDKTLL